MKIVIALVCLLSTIIVAQDVAETMINTQYKCSSNSATHISNEAGGNIAHGQPSSQSEYGPFVMCYSNSLHTQKPNGEADIDVVRKYLADLLEDKADPQKFLDQCSLQQSNSIETARAIFKCFHDALREVGKHA